MTLPHNNRNADPGGHVAICFILGMTALVLTMFGATQLWDGLTEHNPTHLIVGTLALPCGILAGFLFNDYAARHG